MTKMYQSLSTEVYCYDKPIGKSLDGDIEFYLHQLKTIQGVVLEPACGHGRMLIPLFMSGIHIEGFDQSSLMLSALQKEAKARSISPITWRDNLLNFSTNKTYAGIIVPTGTWMLLDTENKSHKALKRCFHALKTGGKIWIDIDASPTMKLGDQSIRIFQINHHTRIELESRVIDFNPEEMVYTSIHHYRKFNQHEQIEEEIERFPLKFYKPNQFITLLETVGFTQVKVYADYQKTSKQNASTLTFEAIK